MDMKIAAHWGDGPDCGLRSPPSTAQSFLGRRLRRRRRSPSLTPCLPPRSQSLCFVLEPGGGGGCGTQKRRKTRPGSVSGGLVLCLAAWFCSQWTGFCVLQPGSVSCGLVLCLAACPVTCFGRGLFGRSWRALCLWEERGRQLPPNEQSTINKNVTSPGKEAKSCFQKFLVICLHCCLLLPGSVQALPTVSSGTRHNQGSVRAQCQSHWRAG